jgi:hypothetical protein
MYNIALLDCALVFCSDVYFIYGNLVTCVLVINMCVR